jgi:DNA helicase IV
LAAHPDLEAEQAYLSRAYDRLDAMRRAAEDLRDSVIDAGRGGTHQARVERDVFVETSLQRLEHLQLGRASLCFGRIDRRNEDDGDDTERFYIGRLAVSDENQEPMVVDWRAPVAEAFYRATGRMPMGLERRRHFATDGRTLLGIEDELFGSGGPGSDGLGEDPAELVGPGALLAALQRSRSGRMLDIVATVQREQDDVIRAELPGVLVVQGGPGTGKTAVALHRAAYLLYTYRFPLEHQGVLVVGPNQTFLRYIEQVLPSLGESGVSLTTPAGLVRDLRPRHADTPEASRVKGDARMADVLRQAVRDRERGLRNPLEVGFGSLTLTLTAGATKAIVATARKRPGPHNTRRRQVEVLLLRSLYGRYREIVEAMRRTGFGGAGDEMDRATFVGEIRRHPVIVAALDRMWPLLAPEDLLNDLFGSPPLLNLATRDILAPDERDALARPRARRLEDVPWTSADAPLLDEARWLLGPIRARRGETDDDIRGYGHIVVDEAQDLAPMVLRMLARRSITGSMTLVGDIGQATSTGAATSWDDVVRHLPGRRPARTAALTVNYRTPAEVMTVAAEVLEAARVPDADPPRSVRALGRLPEMRPVPAGMVAEEVAVAAAAELSAVGEGTVAVIGPAGALPELARALQAAGLPWGDPEGSGLSARVTLLDVPAAKGLEFDSVIVAEPAELVREGGLRSLYVALTRPTRRLVAVHAEPLPESIVRGLARARETLTEAPPGMAVTRV